MGVVLVGLGGRGVQAAAADALVDHRPGPGGEGVPGGHVGGDAVVEGDPLAVHRHRPTGEGGAGPGQGRQAQAAPGGDDRHGGAHHRRVGQVAWPLVHEAGLGQPLDGLAAPVPEGHAADGAGRQDDPAAAGQEVLGDLAAGLGAADDQHRPVRELAGAPVAGGVELGDPPREAAGEVRDQGLVLVAGGHHHRPGLEPAVVGGHRPAVARRGQPGHPDALADGAAVGEPLQPPDDLLAAGVGVPCLPAQHRVHPADGVEPEAVPALVPPGPGDPVPFQDHVLDPAVGQGHAGRQPGRPTAHHHAVDHPAAHLTPGTGGALPRAPARTPPAGRPPRNGRRRRSPQGANRSGRRPPRRSPAASPRHAAPR